MQDLAFATMRMFTVGTAILLGINLLHREVERRTLYTILSRPMSRTVFLCGKYLGLVATTWLMLLCMAVVFGAVSLAAGAPLHMGHVAAVSMLAVEMWIVVSVAILFSSFTTPMLASLFTIATYAVGHLSQSLLSLANSSGDSSVRQLGGWLYQVLPDLGRYDLSIEAVHGLAIPAGALGWPVLYAVLYSSVLLAFASGLFSRRDLR
jgi:ABC-type transport system involved in multi-copper enzyme maturation permease subunit